MTLIQIAFFHHGIFDVFCFESNSRFISHSVCYCREHLINTIIVTKWSTINISRSHMDYICCPPADIYKIDFVQITMQMRILCSSSPTLRCNNNMSNTKTEIIFIFSVTICIGEILSSFHIIMGIIINVFLVVHSWWHPNG